MRSALLLALVLCLGAAAGCSRGAAACTATNAAIPTGSVAFAASLSIHNVSQISLLQEVAAVDGMGNPLRDAAGHELLDPNADPASHTPALTVSALANDAYVDRAHGTSPVTGAIWLDQSSRWTGIRGLGIGTTPILPPGPSGGPFVTIGTASSVVRFPISVADDAVRVDAGPITIDAGPPSPPETSFWEWPWPLSTGMQPMGEGVVPPGLADLALVPRYAPQHDLAFVARSVASDGANYAGGELFVLDIDDPAHVVSLATIDFDSYADAGKHAAPASLFYAPYSNDDGVLFVALDHQNFGPFTMQGPGMVAVVDPGMRRVRTILRMPGMTGCTQITPYIPATRDASDPVLTDEQLLPRIVVTCVGTAPETPGRPPTDGGFVIVRWDPAHLDSLPVIDQTITAVSHAFPRADGGVVPLYEHWIAYVSLGSTVSAFPQRVIAANLITGDLQILESELANGSSTFGFGPGAFDPATGLLVVPHGNDGVLTWQMPRALSAIESTRSAPYQFPGGLARPTTSCSGHVPTRFVRLIGGGGMPTPMMDAGMPPNDAATGDDAGTDAAAPVDAGRDAAAAIDANVDAG